MNTPIEIANKAYLWLFHLERGMKEIKYIHIQGSAKTPEIDLNPVTGEILLAGRSIPENATQTYEPVFQWVLEYVKAPRPISNLRLNLDYFNTSTTLWLAKIVKKLASINKPDYILFIHLYFHIDEFDEMENEDIREQLSPITDMIIDASLSIGIKIYGVDEKGSIIKENMVLI